MFFADGLVSLPSNERLLVVFINTTRRPVDIIWVDFHGFLVKYCELQSGAGFKVDTYTNHCWRCFESYSGTPLHLNGKSFYRRRIAMPRGNDRQESPRIPIRISMPMTSLKDLCLNEISWSLRTQDKVGKLEIPETLKRELIDMIRERKDYSVLTRRDGVRNQQILWYYWDFFVSNQWKVHWVVHSHLGTDHFSLKFFCLLETTLF